MPHHTTASWGAHIDKKVKGALDDVRKRANIAKRKRVGETLNQNLSQASTKEEAWRVSSSAQEDGDIPPTLNLQSQEDLERQDFDVITHFFASGGGGDDDDDERVWQELEKHVCIVVVHWAFDLNDCFTATMQICQLMA